MATAYEDIKELLRVKKLPGLFGRGASEDEINRAERDLGVKFPPSFRTFLMSYGWGYFGSLELIAGLGADIPKEWEAGANIIRVTEAERAGPLKFPHDAIPICQNGAGDWYAMDCSRRERDECPIVFVSHEKTVGKSFDAEKVASNFADWIYTTLAENK